MSALAHSDLLGMGEGVSKKRSKATAATIILAIQHKEAGVWDSIKERECLPVWTASPGEYLNENTISNQKYARWKV